MEDTFHATPDRRLRDRCQAILMAARGRRHRQIAEDLEISGRTLQRGLHVYRAEGFDGLTIQRAAGRAPRIPAWRLKSARGSGKAPWAVGWTAPTGRTAELAAHLYRITGIAVSESTMRAYCTKHGVRPYRPTYRYLKADPARQAAAHQDLQALKNSRRRGAGPAESR